MEVVEQIFFIDTKQCISESDRQIEHGELMDELCEEMGWDEDYTSMKVGVDFWAIKVDEKYSKYIRPHYVSVLVENDDYYACMTMKVDSYNLIDNAEINVEVGIQHEEEPHTYTLETDYGSRDKLIEWFYKLYALCGYSTIREPVLSIHKHLPAEINAYKAFVEAYDAMKKIEQEYKILLKLGNRIKTHYKPTDDEYYDE